MHTIELLWLRFNIQPLFFIVTIPYASRKQVRRNILSDKTSEQKQNIKFSSLTKEETRVMIDVACEGSTSI